MKKMGLGDFAHDGGLSDRALLAELGYSNEKND